MSGSKRESANVERGTEKSGSKRESANVERESESCQRSGVRRIK